MFVSLRSRLALSNLLITLLGLAVVVVVFANLVVQQGVNLKRHDLAKQSAAIARQVERLYAGHGSFADLKRQIDLESYLLGERIIIVSPQGTPVKHLDSADKTPYFSELQYPLNKTALSRGESATALLNGKNVVTFQSPIVGTHGHRNGGAVIYVARAADVNPSPSSLAPVILVAVGTALLVWALIALYFTYSVSRPLLRIADATAEMARGDYGARVKVNAHGEIAYLVSSFNRMAHQVQQSNQVLKDFLANVSHDLRTPLTMIAGYSGALLDGTADPSELETSATVIYEEAVKMQRLVDDLLQLTKLESGLLTLDRHPVDVRRFVQACADRVTRARSSQGVAPIVNLVPESLPRADADPAQLERAMQNLLDNALDYTPPDGSVTVRANHLDPDWIEISVADTGPGIADPDPQRVFERFYRSDKGRERTRGHSGLGLAIVREIVESHGGVVRVESERGIGTTFRFTVPTASGSAPRRAAAPAREPLRTSTSP